MVHGNSARKGFRGMRKGISLIEMLMAIVLLGVLGVISYNYYKVYYDTSFAAKQARVYVIIDQAQQLSNAHDLYEVKNALVPATIADMVTDKQLIRVPDAIPAVTATGWKLYNDIAGAVGTIELDGGATTAPNDIAFAYDIDSTTSSLQDKLDYCNILTNTFQNSWSLSAVDGNVTAIGATPTLAYASAALSNDAFCYASAATVYHMVFVKRVNLTAN